MIDERLVKHRLNVLGKRDVGLIESNVRQLEAKCIKQTR